MATWAMEIPFFLAISSTLSKSEKIFQVVMQVYRSTITLLLSEVPIKFAQGSVLERVEFLEPHGWVRFPRARGDQGMEPTPKCFSVGIISRSSSR
jgi:hypothetical protein